MTGPGDPAAGANSAYIALTIVQDGRPRHVTMRERSAGDKLAVYGGAWT